MKMTIRIIFYAAILFLTGPCRAGTDVDNWKQLDEQVKTLLKQKHADQAIPLAHQALELAIKNHGADHADVAVSEERLADVYRVLDQDKEAQQHYLRALEIRKLAPANDRHAAEAIGSIDNKLGLVYVRQGEYGAAEPLFQQAQTIYGKLFGDDFVTVAIVKGNLADLYVQQGKLEQAQTYYVETISLFEKSLGPEHQGLNHPLSGLGMLYFKQGRYAEAAPLLKRALAVQEKKFGPSDPVLVPDLEHLAQLYRKTGQNTEALVLEQRAAGLRSAPATKN
jgi:tetratricopeptide (TPR) repeat protein